MSRPSLLRRAAAATLGAGPHCPGTTVVARELSLARRVAAAVIGIRSYPTTAPHLTGDRSRAAVRVWEVHRPRTGRPATTVSPSEDDNARHTSLSPSPRPRTPPAPAIKAVEPPTVIIAAGDDDTSPPPRPRPRTWLALAATVAVLATALGVLAYHHTSPDHPQPPSRVIIGDVPRSFVGTWSATITNADGDNTRTLVIKQGRIGDTVMTLTADGPTLGPASGTASAKSSTVDATTNPPVSTSSYHCVFKAPLTAATPTSIRLGASTVAAGNHSYCKPGVATTLTLKDRNALKRTSDSTNETLTYTRTTP